MNHPTFESIWDAIDEKVEDAEYMKLRARVMMALEEQIRLKGWTQAEAAKHLGVTQPRISDLKRGKIDLFGLDTLVSMAVAAGLSVEMAVTQAHKGDCAAAGTESLKACAAPQSDPFRGRYQMGPTRPPVS